MTSLGNLGIPRHMERLTEGIDKGYPDWSSYGAQPGPEGVHQNYTFRAKSEHWKWIYTHRLPVREDWMMDVSQFQEDHYDVPLLLTIAYVILIFGIKWYLADKKPFDLKWPLAVWNLALSVFSGLGLYYVGSVTLYEWFGAEGGGFIFEMCTPYTEHVNAWTLYFILSKIPELVDTIFIVLRKKPLIFLHWYHHIATMWFCWFAWARRLDCGGSFAMMNLFVHTIMYFYYFCSALGIYWPDWAKQSITTLQLSQMIGGLSILGTAWIYCPYDKPLLIGGFLMYFSYFVLFAILFYDLYFNPATAEKRAPKEKAKPE